MNGSSELKLGDTTLLGTGKSAGGTKTRRKPYKGGGTVCKFWRKGTCNRGDTCRFDHCETKRESLKPAKHEKKKINRRATAARKQGQKPPNSPKDFVNVQDLGKTQETQQRGKTQKDTTAQADQNKARARSNRRNRRRVTKGDKKNKTAFHGFFNDGSAGCSLFIAEGGIRSYLSAVDLVACAQTRLALHRISRTYTIPEILRHKEPNAYFPRDLRISLGLRAMETVVAYGNKNTRPTRVVIAGSSESFRAKLYHPEELLQIHRLIDGFLRFYQGKGVVPHTSMKALTQPGQDDEAAPVLVSAFYGMAKGHKFDVTRKVSQLVQEHGILDLAPPPPIRDGRGRMQTQPSTFRLWYNHIFGDPCPHTPKRLVIKTRDPQTGRTTTRSFPENTTVSMKMKMV